MVAAEHPATQSAPASATPSPLQARVETGLIIAGLLALFVLLQHTLWGDGLVRFNALSALLQQGRLVASKYSLIGPLFSTPLWLLGKIVAGPEWWLLRYNVLVFGLGLLAIYWILKDRVDRGLLRKFFLLLIAASMFPFHLGTYYGETFTAMCVGVGLLAAVVGPSLPGWIAIVLGVANTPATAVGLAGIIIKRILDMRRLRFILAGVAAAALIGAESWIRRGSPSTTNYEPGFTYPLFFGVINVLFSFGVGIIFYAPGLLLPVRNYLMRLREHGMKADLWGVYVLWLIFLACIVLVYSRWYDWSGGFYWGPRFFLFAAIPASFALAVRMHQRNAPLAANIITTLVLLLSLWVGFDGALFGMTTLNTAFHGYQCPPQISWQATAICYDSPQLSALWQPFIVASELNWNVRAFIAAEHLGKRDFLFAAYLLVVYAYLALPLLRTVAQQMRVHVVSYTRAYLHRFAF